MTYIEFLPKALIEDIVENRCIPIIGAGFSRNAKVDNDKEMPLWSDIAKHFKNQLTKEYDYVNPLDPISDFCHKFGKATLVQQLRRILFTGKVHPNKAHIAFARLPFDLVITTNFDFLLEDSYRQIGRECLPILEEDQLSISNMGSKDKDITVLLKIHGDLNHAKNMIVTEEEYDSYVNLHPLMSTYIAYLLITRTPLFIGYSLDDPDFRIIWQIIKTRLGKLKRHAYSISINVDQTKLLKFERRGITIIPLLNNNNEI